MATALKLSNTVEANAQITEEIRTVWSLPSLRHEAIPLVKLQMTIKSRMQNPVCSRKTVKSVMAVRKIGLCPATRVAAKAMNTAARYVSQVFILLRVTQPQW